MNEKVKYQSITTIWVVIAFVICSSILFCGFKFFQIQRRHIIAYSDITGVTSEINRRLNHTFSSEGQYPESLTNITDALLSRNDLGVGERRIYAIIDSDDYSSDGDSYEMSFQISLNGDKYYLKQGGSKGKRIVYEYYRNDVRIDQ